MLTSTQQRGRIVVVVPGSQPSQRSNAELEALAASWLDSYESPNTRAAYRADLAAFSRWCADRRTLPLDVSTQDVAAYLAATQATGNSPATSARRRSALASFFAFAQGAELVASNPVSSVLLAAPAEPSATVVLDDHDAAALLRASDRLGPKPAALVRLLMLDGLKLGEVLEADAGAFRDASNGGVLAVDRGRRTHDVALVAPTARRLQQYLGRRRRGPLFLSDTPGRDGERLTRFGADYVLKEVARAASVRARVSANALRRRYVAAAVRGGAHIDDVRDHLGHRDARTTRRYLDPSDSEGMPGERARPVRR